MAPLQTPLGELTCAPRPDPLSEFKGAYRGREGKGWGKGARDGDEGGKEEGRREGMEVGRGKGDRGNGKDRTGHGIGRGGEVRETGRGGKGRRWATVPQTSIPGAAIALTSQTIQF